MNNYVFSWLGNGNRVFDIDSRLPYYCCHYHLETEVHAC